MQELRKYRFIREEVEGVIRRTDSRLRPAGMTNGKNQLALSSSGLSRGSRLFSTLIQKTKHIKRQLPIQDLQGRTAHRVIEDLAASRCPLLNQSAVRKRLRYSCHLVAGLILFLYVYQLLFFSASLRSSRIPCQDDISALWLSLPLRQGPPL